MSNPIEAKISYEQEMLATHLRTLEAKQHDLVCARARVHDLCDEVELARAAVVKHQLALYKSLHEKYGADLTDAPESGTVKT